MPTAADLFVPVVDISRHQGDVDFATMRTAGVHGLIIRATHSTTVDARAAGYAAAARAAGWRDDQLGFYTFVNPKRAPARSAAKAFVDTVGDIFGHTDVLAMLDVESYRDEYPNPGTMWPADQFAPWLREHRDAVAEFAPQARLIGYSNASFWNTWVADSGLAAELEWIVPRYPVYPPPSVLKDPLQLAAWIATSPKPPAPDGWARWAFEQEPAGPRPPAGAVWAGWQFSAGFNRQGPRYGCSSTDLDLNVVEEHTWRRWTATDPQPPIGEPMTPYVFRLHDGGIGVRDVTGARSINGGELEGPLAGERVWDVPAGSAWEYWIRRELDRYVRELDPPPPVAVEVPYATPAQPANYVGTITLTAAAD